MKRLYSSIDIEATPEQVWEVLTDFAKYPSWNPFLTRISGVPELGARLEVRFEPPHGMSTTLRPTVLEVVPGRSLRWIGRLLVPGIFDGEHHFVLERLPERGTRVVQQERFTGVLVPLFASSLDQHTLAGFHAMNAALKRRLEASVTA